MKIENCHPKIEDRTDLMILPLECKGSGLIFFDSPILVNMVIVTKVLNFTKHGAGLTHAFRRFFVISYLKRSVAKMKSVCLISTFPKWSQSDENG